MSDDYETIVKTEIKTTIALCFTVDHPELVYRTALAMTGYSVSDRRAKLRRKIIEATWQRKCRAAAAAMADGMTSGLLNPVSKTGFWVLGKNVFGATNDASDGLVELEAEDKFNFKEHLADIRVPTLVIGGETDSFYPVRETVEGILNAKLILYKKSGHIAMYKSRFNHYVLSFLSQDKT